MNSPLFKSLAVAVVTVISIPAGAQVPGIWNPFPQTTTPSALGVGTVNPAGWQEINYCNDIENGLVITKEDCGFYTVGPNDFLNPTYDGIFEPIVVGPPTVDPDPGGGGGGVVVPVLPFIPPINFSLTGFNTSPAKPMIWARTKNTSLFPGASGSHTSRFIVTPYGRSGLNIENPRATLDIKSIGGRNMPAMIIGRQKPGTSNKTQHMHFVPWLNAHGYNRISQAEDQGMFFTDGMGPDGSNSNGAFIIAPWSADANAGGLRMDKDGNVEIRGNTRTTKVMVNAKWWPDFVFNADYALISLDSVQTFIEKNNHLPGIPPAQEIEKNGQDLGQMQQLQMQKIEELTLYTLQQHETIKKQDVLLQEQAQKLKELEEKFNQLLNK